MSIGVDLFSTGNLADDQLASQFIFQIIDGTPIGKELENISLRMDQTFEVPEEIIGTYEFSFRGMKVPKTNMTEGTTKEFSVEVRNDSGWAIYKALKAYKDKCYDANKGIALSDSATRCTVAVQALDYQGNVKCTWTFKYSKIKQLKAGTFDNGSEDPSRLAMTWLYGKMEVS